MPGKFPRYVPATNELFFIGDVPGMSQLTGLHRTQASEKELVIFITPDLVRPLDPDQAVKLPGWEILDPNDVEFYLWGKLESQRPEDFRSPVRTDLGRMARYYHGNDLYIIGPKGYTEYR